MGNLSTAMCRFRSHSVRVRSADRFRLRMLHALFRILLVPYYSRRELAYTLGARRGITSFPQGRTTTLAVCLLAFYSSSASSRYALAHKRLIQSDKQRAVLYGFVDLVDVVKSVVGGIYCRERRFCPEHRQRTVALFIVA